MTKITLHIACSHWTSFVPHRVLSRSFSSLVMDDCFVTGKSLDWGLSVWLTTLLQCFDTVGWVFWPVKTVGRITYIVLVQTLNHAQSINQPLRHNQYKLIIIFFCSSNMSLLLEMCVRWLLTLHRTCRIDLTHDIIQLLAVLDSIAGIVAGWRCLLEPQPHVVCMCC